MADVEYRIQADTSGAVRSLNTLKGSLGAVTRSFGGLSAAIGGLGIAAGIASIVRYADSIKDMSNATGVAIENIQGLGKVFQQNGGSIEGANRALLRLVQAVDAAAGGSKEAIIAFNSVGIGLKDLGKLSEQDLLERTIQGLANITDASERAATAKRLLGREALSIDWPGVAGGYKSAAEEAKKMTAAINSAAKAQDSIDIATGKVKDGLLLAIKPLADFVGNLKPEEIQKFINATLEIAKALTAIAASMTVLKAIGSFLAAIGTYAALAAAGVASLGVTFGKIKQTIGNFIAGTARFQGAFGGIFQLIKELIIRFGYLAAGLLRITPLFAVISTAAYALHTILKELFNINLIDKFYAGLQKIKNWFTRESPAATKPTSGNLTEQLNPGASAAAGGGRGFVNPPLVRGPDQEELDRLADLKREQAGIAAQAKLSYQQNLANSKAEFDQRLATLRLDQELIGVIDREAAGRRAAAEEAAKIKETIRGLKQQLETAQTEQRFINPKDEIAAGQVANKIKLIRDQIDRYQELLKVNPELIKKEVDQLERGRFLREVQLRTIQMMIDAQEEYNQAYSQFLKDQGDAQNTAIETVNNLIKSNKLAEDRELLERNIRNQRQEDQDLARKLFDLEVERKKVLEDIAKIPNITGEARAQQEARANQEFDRRKGIIQGISDITKAQQEDFLYGWEDALSKWQNNMKSNAEQAADAFSTFTRGFEDSIVRFVQTGKLSFRSLFNDLIAQAARAASNKLLMSLFGSIGGSMGLRSLFGGFGFGTGFGFGNQDFGGFFANGGTLGAGKFGIAGESGPELVTGPATITPMGALAQPSVTNVTYNIQAVDASSFRALVARDPEFIFQITEQGRRSLPTRSRR